jgi:hypothetical protein
MPVASERKEGGRDAPSLGHWPLDDLMRWFLGPRIRLRRSMTIRNGAHE